MAHDLDNVGMLERLTALQTEPRHTELADFVYPLFYIGQRRMRDGVIVLVAVSAIEVALVGDVEMRDPGFSIESA